MDLERAVNIAKGLGELGVDLAISYQVCQTFSGDAPWYVGVPYAVAHGFLVADSVSRIVIGQPCYRGDEPEPVIEGSVVAGLGAENTFER